MVKKELAREMFEAVDKNGDGYISAAEFHDALTAYDERVTDSEVQEMFLAADVDGDGLINYEEYVKLLQDKQGH